MTIKLEGRIAGPWVAEFNREWRSLAPSLGSKKLSVDLRGVTFVDGHGRQLLREIYEKTGADIVADTPLTMYFAEEAMRGKWKENKAKNRGEEHKNEGSLRFRVN